LEKESRITGPATIWNKNFICVMISNFMLCMAHFSINPLVATYAEFLHATPRLIGLLAGMFFGVALAMRPFTGTVVTKIDKKKLLVFVFVLGAVANIGYALFHSIPAFVAFRIIHGLQFSLVGLVLTTLAGDNVPKDKMISGIGIFGISGASASAIAPSIGDSLIRFGMGIRGETFGFTILFLYGAVIFIIAIIPAMMIASDNKTKEEVASVGAWYKTIFSIHALPIMFIVFMVMIPHSMIHTYMFDFGREQGIAGISIFYLALAITLTVTRPLSGMLTDKLGLEKIMYPGLTLMAVSMFVIGSSNDLVMAVVGAVMFAVGFGSTQPSFSAMCMQMESPIKRGVASNTLYIGLDLGLFLGPVVGGVVRDVGNFSIMYRTAAVPIVIAIIAFAIILPVYRRRINELEDMDAP